MICAARLASHRLLQSVQRTPPIPARTFHSTTPKRAFPPLLMTLMKPVARVLAVVVGRGARIWWQRLPKNHKFQARLAFLQHRKKVYGAGIGFCAALYYLYESHVEACPVTGRRRFVALTPEQVKKIGRQEFKTLLSGFQENIVPERHPVYDKVAKVANRILRGNRDLRQIYDKDWTVTVVEDPMKNAFVLPSGNIFVFTGMLEICSNEDQLGVVLAHEMAHTVLGHVQEKLTLVSFVELVLLIPLALLWALLPNDGVALVANWFIDKVVAIMIELPFSRDMETEADQVGMLMAAKACLDVREAPAFWGKMELLADNPLETDKDFEFISTHPCHSSRQEFLTGLLDQALQTRAKCGCEQVDPLRDPLKEVRMFKSLLENRQGGRGLLASRAGG